MRFIVSAILGTLVTVAMLVIALSFFDEHFSKASLRPAVEVKPLPRSSRLDVADWLRETRGDLREESEREALEALLDKPPPKWELEERDVHGFVQLNFTVRPDGSVTDIEVYGAVPPGIYEERARQIVAARSYAPGYDADGDPVARRALDVVEFTVPAEVARRASAEADDQP